MCFAGSSNDELGKILVALASAEPQHHLATSCDCHQLTPGHGLDCATCFHPLTGVSILLIPFSFDFVDALCVATVLGFVCAVSNEFISRGMFVTSSKVAATGSDGSLSPETNQRNSTRQVTSTFRNRPDRLTPIDSGNRTVQTGLSTLESGDFSPTSPFPLQTMGMNGVSRHMPRHKSLPSIPSSWVSMSRLDTEEGSTFEEQEGGKKQPLCILPGRSSPQPPHQLSPNAEDSAQSKPDVEVPQDGRLSFSSKISSTSTRSLSSCLSLGRFRRVKVGSRSKRVWTESVKKIGSDAMQTMEPAQVHWKLALIATVELVLKVVNDQRQK